MKPSRLVLILVLLFSALAASAQIQSFGKTQDGTEVTVYTIKNRNGIEARISDFGATVVAILTPDRTGHRADIVLGFDKVDDYEKPGPYFGAVVGRYANRIAKGQFTLGGHKYQVTVNDPPNMLHGGKAGFDKKMWKVVEDADEIANAIHLRYVSKDGEEGFPGKLTVTVGYTLTDANELKIEYSATTDKPTVVNLTNHSYFNLAGQGDGEITAHEVQINATQFTPVDENLIPTGKLAPVAGTPLDFRKVRIIGERIDDADAQMKLAKGYDFNYVLGNAGKLVKAARVHDPKSGRVMEVSTTEPGLQFYTGNHIDGEIHGKAGKTYKFRSGLCLETQHYPDSPNHPNFPTTELKPGQKFHSTTIYRFTTDAAK